MDRSILVGTGLGAAAQWARDRFGLFHQALTSVETLGTQANGMIAKRLLDGLCGEGRIFVDVGAHIGSVIDSVSRSSKPSKIYAVEAVPAKAASLKTRFPQVTIIECAVGESEGSMPFYVDHERPGYSSLFSGHAGQGRHVEEIRVDVRRLDQVVPAENVDLIKIDVEGAELGVLIGATAIIAASAPVIVFESGPEEFGSYTKEAMWRWFDEADYAVLVPNRVAHLDDGLTEAGFVESHLYPRRTTDYLAVPRRRRAEIRGRARTILGL